jgi:hypothetical protein
MSAWATVKRWFAAFNTKHNWFAIGMTAVRAAEVVGDATTGREAAAVAEAGQVVDAAKSVHVDGFAPSSSSSTSTPTK